MPEGCYAVREELVEWPSDPARLKSWLYAGHFRRVARGRAPGESLTGEMK